MAEFLRAAWGAQPSKSVEPRLAQVPNGVVHHIGGGDPYPSNVVATLQQIQSTEQHGDYADIAYNWGVDKDGNLWELRGDVRDGATLGYAGTSFSVLAICNAAAPNFSATPALIAGIAACFRNAQTRGVLTRNAYIDGHHWFDTHETNAPTSCPSLLMGAIPQIRTLVAGGSTPTPAPKPILLEDDVFTIEVNGTDTNPKVVGVQLELSTKKITSLNGGVLVPDPAPFLANPNPCTGAWQIADDTDGTARCRFVTKDTDKYTFRVKAG